MTTTSPQSAGTHSFEKIVLTTGRLQLRPLRPSDAVAILSIRSNPEVMRYHTTLPWDSINPANAMVANDLKNMREGQYLRLGLERVTDGAMIGTCGLFGVDEQCKRAEIGYELVRSAWGHGYMHEALKILLAYAFNDMALNRIEADVHPDNQGSIKSLQRLGFQKEGYLRERWIVGDEVSDSVLFGLLRRDWLA